MFCSGPIVGPGVTAWNACGTSGLRSEWISRIDRIRPQSVHASPPRTVTGVGGGWRKSGMRMVCARPAGARESARASAIDAPRTGIANATLRFVFAGRKALLGDALHEVRGRQEETRRTQPAEPAVVDVHDLPGAVEAREDAVHGEPEFVVAARQGQGIGLDGEVLV